MHLVLPESPFSGQIGSAGNTPHKVGRRAIKYDFISSISSHWMDGKGPYPLGDIGVIGDRNGCPPLLGNR